MVRIKFAGAKALRGPCGNGPQARGYKESFPAENIVAAFGIVPILPALRIRCVGR
jgi:hypothetical protein